MTFADALTAPDLDRLVRALTGGAQSPVDQAA